MVDSRFIDFDLIDHHLLSPQRHKAESLIDTFNAL